MRAIVAVHIHLLRTSHSSLAGFGFQEERKKGKTVVCTKSFDF